MSLSDDGATLEELVELDFNNSMNNELEFPDNSQGIEPQESPGVDDRLLDPGALGKMSSAPTTTQSASGTIGSGGGGANIEGGSRLAGGGGADGSLGGGDEDDLEGRDIEAEAAAARFYQIARFRPYFDVSTRTLGRRLLKAIFPIHPGTFFEGLKPDLYGPFWIATTLIFIMAATGNFASYVSSDSAVEWTSDFAKVTTAAGVLYSLISVIPLIVWFMLTWLPADQTPALTQVVAVYGYSLTAFVPVCFLCVIPSTAVQWTFIAIGFAISTWILESNFFLIIPENSRKQFIHVFAFIFVCQAGLALVMKLYFFAFAT